MSAITSSITNVSTQTDTIIAPVSLKTSTSSQTTEESQPVIDPNLSSLKKEEAVNTSAILAKCLETKVINDIIGLNPFVISAEKVKQIKDITGLTDEALLRQLVPIAKQFARPPISNYHVGVAGLGKSGNIYLGVNLEFPGFPLNATVHGEQFLIANARNQGETELKAIAISAAPCGHCRQFLNELGGDSDPEIFFNKPNAKGEMSNTSKKLSDLLPESFGPQDLGLKGGLLTPVEFSKSKEGDALTASAFDAARSSYAPFSKSFSGVAIKTRDNMIYSGPYLENAAFNPGLSPLQSALVALVADRHYYADICEVVLVEDPTAIISQAAITSEILKSISSEAKFRITCFED